MLLSLLAAALAAATPSGHPCRAALPRGPSVPAPIVLRTTCGGFRLARNGRVSTLPHGWFARRAGGTGRTYGADLALRRNRAGRVFLLRGGRVVWRSRGLYPNDGGDVAFGPHTFAFASYRRGIFLTDLNGPERRVVSGRGRYPLGFLSSGELLVSASGSIVVVARDGTALRRFPYRARHGYAFEERTRTLFFVTRHGVLAEVHGVGPARLVRRLSGIEGTIGLARPDLLVFYGAFGFDVLRRDGTPVARTRWRGARFRVSDSGVSVSPEGRAFAFRLTDRRSGSAPRRAVVYVLRAGEGRVREIYRHRLGTSGCWVGAALTWHGRHLLYASSDGRLAVLDSYRHTTRSLTSFTRRLPQRSRGELVSANWASDFR